MLFTLQRYEFFSKSQLLQAYALCSSRCCLPYKGTNFSANHNMRWWCSLCHSDVVYPTKVRIFQQITTGHGRVNRHKEMLFTLQRYEFFSKSQRLREWSLCSCGCCLPYKGTNFSANHNVEIDIRVPDRMLFTLQRYEFFSKSQQSSTTAAAVAWCCLPYKGTNFSANHNQFIYLYLEWLDVVYPTKVRIFQQITTYI